MPSLAERIKKHILDNVGIEKFVEKLTTVAAVNHETGEMRIGCVAHDDGSPSASMRMEDGVWYCFVPHCAQNGDLISFYGFAKGIPDSKETIRRLAVELELIVDIPEAKIVSCCKLLQEFPDAAKNVCETLGISEMVLRYFQIGMDKRHTKDHGEQWFITIPIKGPSGEYEDIRLYNRRLDPKIRSWTKGSGKPKIFPFEVLVRNDTVILFEGEKDCLRAQSMGIRNAITSTGSAGTLPGYYAEIFKNKTVYVCFDIDKAGRAGVSRVVNRLIKVCAELYVIDLPTEGLPENGDFSDWANLGNGIGQWQALVEGARKIETQQEKHGTQSYATTGAPGGASFGGEEPPPYNEEDVREIDFRQIASYKNYKEPVRFLAHTIGVSASLKSFEATAEVEVMCPRNLQICQICTVRNTDPEQMPLKMTLNHNSEESLDLVRVSKKQKLQTIKKLCGIPEKCNRCVFNETRRAPIQQMLLSPAASLGEMREFYADFRPAFFQGSQLPDNRDYWFTGYIQADPKTQETVINIHKAEPARNAIENFEVNEETFQAINWFRLQKDESIPEHFDRLHRIIENDIGIYGRYEVQQAVLETVFSALEFWCGDKHIRNGWNEVLLIGDTRTGKSTAVELMMRMINVGEFISCENASVAGLIGGIEYVDKMPVPVWGAWPTNNGGMIALDEVDALSEKEGNDITGHLSAMRSSGKAEIQKIVQATTIARVRSIWITNPRGGQKMSTFNGGVNAIQGIIPSRQDIARFTKAYAVNGDDVPVETITDVRPRIQDAEIRRYWNTLAILTWSLQPEQVCFEDAAQRFLRSSVKFLTEKYHDGIPLIEKGSALDKIAKLSVPVAVLCGSFEERDGNLCLIVREEHAQYAFRHLCQTYDSPAMGYDEYSNLEFRRSTIAHTEEVRDAFVNNRSLPRDQAQAILTHLLTATSLTARYFEELVGLPMTAKQLWSILIRNHCLQPTPNGAMMKTAPFVGFIKTMLSELAEQEAREQAAINA